MDKIHTVVEIVFFPSVARMRHLYSSASPALANLFFCDLDFKEAKITTNSKTKINSQTHKLKILLHQEDNIDTHIYRHLLRVTQTEPFSVLRSNMLVSSLRKGSSCRRTQQIWRSRRYRRLECPKDMSYVHAETHPESSFMCSAGKLQNIEITKRFPQQNSDLKLKEKKLTHSFPEQFPNLNPKFTSILNSRINRLQNNE